MINSRLPLEIFGYPSPEGVMRVFDIQIDILCSLWSVVTLTMIAASDKKITTSTWAFVTPRNRCYLVSRSDASRDGPLLIELRNY